MPQARIRTRIGAGPWVFGTRRDIPLGATLEVANEDVGGETSYQLEVLDAAPGSAVALANPAPAVGTSTTLSPFDVDGRTVHLRLIVQGSGGPYVDEVHLTVKNLETGRWIPAAGEDVNDPNQTYDDVADGWAPPVQSDMDEAMRARAQGVILVGEAGEAGLVPGNTVRVSGRSLKGGALLVNQRPWAIWTKALATQAGHVDETVGIVLGGTDGSPTPALGAAIRVLLLGPYPTSLSGSPAVGDPVYGSDTGTLSLTPGTRKRQVGHVMSAPGGGVYYAWIDGALGGGGGGGDASAPYLILASADDPDLSAEILVQNLSATVAFTAGADIVPLAARRSASQTADIFQVQDQAGAALARFDSAGRLVVPDGGPGALGLSFAGQTTTGFYLPAAGALSAVVAGGAALDLDATNVTVWPQNLLLRHADPQIWANAATGPLVIRTSLAVGDADAGVRIWNSAGTRTGGDILEVGDGSTFTELFAIREGGRLSLTPRARTGVVAEVAYSSIAAGSTSIAGSFATQRFHQFPAPSVVGSGVLTHAGTVYAEGAIQGESATVTNSWAFWAGGGTLRGNIRAEGQITIATAASDIEATVETNPALRVFRATRAVAMFRDPTNDVEVVVGHDGTNGGLLRTHTAHPLKLGAGGTDWVTLSTAGDLLVGDTATSPKLRLGGSTSAFPMLKRDGVETHFRLADDTDYAPLKARADSTFFLDTSGVRTFQIRTAGDVAFDVTAYRTRVSARVTNTLALGFVRLDDDFTNNVNRAIHVGNGRNAAGVVGQDTYSPTTATDYAHVWERSVFTPNAAGVAADFAAVQINPTINGSSAGVAAALAIASRTNTLTGGTIYLVDAGTTSDNWWSGYTRLFSVDVAGTALAGAGGYNFVVAPDYGVRLGGQSNSLQLSAAGVSRVLVGAGDIDLYYGTSGVNNFRIHRGTPGSSTVALEINGNGRDWTPGNDNASALGSTSRRFTNFFQIGYHELAEIADPATPGANSARLYLRDNGAGKCQLAIKYPDGVVNVIDTQA